jgi:hypothetical protein
MNFRGVYSSGMLSCFNFWPSFGIWNILDNQISVENTEEDKIYHLPEDTSGDPNQAVGAKLSREAPSVVETFKDQGSKVKQILMGVIEPRSAGQGKDTW